MKQILFICSMLLAWPSFALDFGGNKLLSYKLWKTVSKEELSKTMKERHVPKSLLNPKYDVDIYDVTYKSCWFDSTCILASGLVFVPKGLDTPMPEVVYHHGTRVEKGRRKNITGEDYLCLGMAVDGYLVLQPDYIGLGYGDKFHLYQQYKSLGQASVDFIYAARELSDSLKFSINQQLFLTGYSEGGYAAVAANKLIQESYPDLKVTATAGNSGAYDMAGVQSEVMFKKYSRGHYLPYLLRGLNEIYHIVPDINTIYKPPYDTLIPQVFDGKHTFKEIDAYMPEVPKDMIRDTFVNLFLSDPNFPLHKALDDNSLCFWKPENPIQLCYCKADEQVNYRNSIVAQEGMKKLGAKHITTRNAGNKYGHTKCALFASMYSKLYFDSFRKGSKYGRPGNAGKRFMLALAKLAIKP
ncbi:MAG: lipase family protein [Chitinophagales bacterium]